jgi:hypothetical protein
LLRGASREDAKRVVDEVEIEEKNSRRIKN